MGELTKDHSQNKNVAPYSLNREERANAPADGQP